MKRFWQDHILHVQLLLETLLAGLLLTFHHLVFRSGRIYVDTLLVILLYALLVMFRYRWRDSAMLAGEASLARILLLVPMLSMLEMTTNDVDLGWRLSDRTYYHFLVFMVGGAATIYFWTWLTVLTYWQRCRRELDDDFLLEVRRALGMIIVVAGVLFTVDWNPF